MLLKLFSFITVLIISFLIPLGIFYLGYQTGVEKNLREDVPKEYFVTSEKSIDVSYAIASAFPIPSPSPRVLVSEDVLSAKSEATTDLFDTVNEYRSEHQLSRLKKNTTICAFVDTRMKQLEQAQKLDQHAGFTTEASAFLQKNHLSLIAENLAAGFANTHDVVFNGWEHSMSHQATLLNHEYNEGCAAFENGFAVLIVAKK